MANFQNLSVSFPFTTIYRSAISRHKLEKNLAKREQPPKLDKLTKKRNI